MLNYGVMTFGGIRKTFSSCYLDEEYSLNKSSVKNTLENIIDVLEKICDLKFQKDVWLEGKYWDRVSSFEEAVNTLEDYNFFVNVTKNSIGLTESEKIIIESFNSRLVKYECENVERMLQDNVWIRIVDSAKEVHKIIQKYYW